MSGMANEMAARIADDGGAGLGGDSAPGNEGGQSAPPAGASNTDTQTGGQAPDTIPYARFKEVNDRLSALKGYEQLAQYGYDSDSLGRLAAFEAQYQSDPVGTLASMADNLDLPQDVKDAIRSAAVGSPTDGGQTSTASGSAEGDSSGAQQPPAIPREVQDALDYVNQMRERDATQARDDQLGRVLAAWDSTDKEQGIETPDMIKLAAIQQMAGSGQTFQTVEDLASASRKTIMDYRDALLGSAVRRTGLGEQPLSLPGGGSSSAPPVKFDSIRAASRAAQQAIERQELPGT